MTGQDLTILVALAAVGEGDPQSGDEQETTGDGHGAPVAAGRFVTLVVDDSAGKSDNSSQDYGSRRAAPSGTENR